MAMLFMAATLGLVLTSRPAAPWPWLCQPGLVLAVFVPLLMARLLHGSRPLPVWQRAVLWAGALSSTFDILVLWRPMGFLADDKQLHAVLPAAHFVAGQCLVALNLVERSLATRGVVRWRFGLAAAACVLTVAALALISLGEFPLSLMLWRGALTGAAGCAFIAFGVPEWLAHLLNVGELYRYLRRKEERPLTGQAKAVPDELCRLAAEATGASGALLALWQAQQERWQVVAAQGRVGWQSGMALPEAVPPSVRFLYRVELTIVGGPPGLLLVGVPHLPLFPEDDLGLLRLLAGQVARDLGLDRAYRYPLEVYAGATAADQALSDPCAASPGGARRPATVLFADIRGFSRWAESAPAEQVMTVLNLFFAAAIEQAHLYGGTVTHLAGDGLMVLFGVERHGAGQARAAVRTGAGIIRQAAAIRHDSLPEPLQVGCGINTGEVIVGNIGSANRLVYTAVGDPVNVARRIMEGAGPGEVRVGEATAELLSDMVLEPMGAQAVKNRRESVTVYRVRGEGVP